MQFKHIYTLSFLFFIISCTKSPQTSNPRLSVSKLPEQENLANENDEQETVINLGDSGITEGDLIVSLENTTTLDTGTTENVFNEILRKKLFVMEARSLGMDKDTDFVEHLKSNIRLIVEDDLTDQEEIDKLGEEAYNRYLKELNVSHAFISLKKNASPSDTLKAFHQLNYIREQANTGKSFDTIVEQYAKTEENEITGAPLGWFSVFNLIYPLENVVYNTPVGGVSLPIRSDAGYHIFKVNNSRPNSGTVKVQHIWKYIPKSATSELVDSVYNYLDVLKSEIEKGADFSEMAERFSDDINTRENGGVLPEFGIGTRTEAAFEEVAFGLEVGEISKPFRSSSGYHIIRLMERKKPLSKDAFLEANEGKLTTDSRGEYLKNKRLEEFVKNNKVNVNKDLLSKAINFSNNNIINGKWEIPKTIILNDRLLSINERHFKVIDYFNYVTERQDVEKWEIGDDKWIFNYLFEKFMNNEIIKYQQDIALKENSDVNRWAQAFEEDLLYSMFFDQYILSKSLSDSLGQKRYYQQHQGQFKKREYGTLSVFSFENSETYDHFKNIVNGEKPFKLNRGIKPIYYDKNVNSISREDLEKLQGLVRIMNNNPGYIVEIGGHRDSQEASLVSSTRLQNVVNQLVELGIPLKRILEVDYKNSVIHDRFDWSKNQVVTFQFFSNDPTDLLPTFNNKNEDAVRYQNFKINRDDFEERMGKSWESQTGLIEVDGRIEEFTLRVRKSTGDYRDYLTEIIAGYQNEIIADYENKLAEKFKLEYNKDNIYKLIEELKSKE